MGLVSLSVIAIILCQGGAYAEQQAQRKTMKAYRLMPERTLPEDVPKIAFWDAHVHLNDLEMQLALMKEGNVSGAVVFWGRNSTNESVIKAAQAHPEKLIPFVSVSPERRSYRRLWNADAPKLIETLESLLNTGVFRGIGEISVTHFPSPGFPEAEYDPNASPMIGIMRLAQRFGLPITIHCELTKLSEFSALLARFREVKVIWAHGGYTPYFLARRMLENHPNLYYELSARTWVAHPRSPDYTIFKNSREIWREWRELIEEIPERFLVGTDASHHSLAREQSKITSVQLLLMNLSPETRRKVASENLLTLTQ